MSVHIIVVSFNCVKLVETLSVSLAKLSYQDFVVHIVENGSVESFRELASCAVFTDFGLDSKIEPNLGTISFQQGRLSETGNTVVLYHAKDNLGYAGAINCVDYIEKILFYYLSDYNPI